MLQASQLTSHQPVRFSSGSNDACDACNIDGRCSSTAVHCCNTFWNMDNPRNSRNSCVGNNHNCSPGIRSSRIGTRGNRIRFRRGRFQPKPERQPLLPAPEPVRLLPMEVKEVFSYIPLLFVSEVSQLPAKECVGAAEKRGLFLSYYYLNPTSLAVP